MKHLIAALLILLAALTAPARAQDLTVATVTRAPFSMVEGGRETGFSLDLWAEIAARLGRDYDIDRKDSFAQMLGAVQEGEADLAIANISITAAREEVMDFSHPIFESGLQIMVPRSDGSNAALRAFFSLDFLLAVLAAFAILFGSGMLMWRLERRAQPYFDHDARRAMFPAFWWALNLVVNGGFEERQPRTPIGRLLGVVLVISSLFLVSFFVAKITAALTVDALQNNVTGVGDLYGRRVATIGGSTAESFLAARDIRTDAYDGPDTLFAAFEEGTADIVVFDAPILAYYVTHEGADRAELAGPVFLRENYGIALPQGSPLLEPVNRALLALREEGVHDDLHRKWFGTLAQ